jgi:hypothetical protein
MIHEFPLGSMYPAQLLFELPKQAGFPNAWAATNEYDSALALL